MSDSDNEENYSLYGTPLEPYDEDEIPSKKPILIEDQIATDAHGRRRFHGAFTGGFAAGFCNTVGSLEGWVPKNFKSSRSEKASEYTQKPEDFMDDEDIAEFGFAPQGLRATDDYNSIEKPRKRRFRPPDGPIPGQPVLQLLLEPVKETIGVKLLKQMGWKPGQGVGPRLTKTEKKKARKRIYGCAMPPEFEKKADSSESEDGSDDEEITFAPDDYSSYICQPKENSSGMGYVGLNKTAVLSGFTSKEPSHFTVIDRNNKKLSIQGQAFGVGALEDDDEDIYSKEDMSRYDFELGDTSTKSKTLSIEKSNILSSFVKSVQQIVKKYYPLPNIPKNFIPKHGARISRFEPLSEEKQRELDRLSKSRHSLNANERSAIIEDDVMTVQKNTINKQVDKFEKEQNEITPKKNANVQTSIKPSFSNADKQERFEKFLELAKKDEKDKLQEIQPISMTEWDREQERNEFEQALKINQPRPTNFLVFDRFVSAQFEDDVNNPLAQVESMNLHGTADMREAAKRKMFGKLTREILPWHPSSLLCKRFNVPEPFVNTDSKKESKKKNVSIFDYLHASVSNKISSNLDTIEKGQKNLLPTENIIEKKSSSVEKCDKSNQSVITSPIVTESVTEISHSDTQSDKPNENIVEETNIENITSESNNKIDVWQTPSNIIKENKTEEIVLNTENKIDVYKAIFLDSESENENDESESSKSKQEEIVESKFDTFKNDIIADINKNQEINISTIDADSDIHIPTFTVATVKPTGIFQNIDLQTINDNINKPITKSEDETNNISVQSDDNNQNIYGPKLPTEVNFFQKNVNISRNINILVKNSEDNAGVWIEKTSNQPKKSKKSKKSKRKTREKKSHHKKHKKSSSKHKKKKYSDDSDSSSSSN